MDLTMGLLSAFLTIALFSPFFYAAYIGRKQKKKIQDSFTEEIKINDYNFDFEETWGHSFIGIDRKKSKLVYMRSLKNELIKEEILLDTIKNCTLINDELRKKANGNMQVKLLNLDLELVLSGPIRSTKKLNFFDSNNFIMEDHESERAEKWRKLILSQLVQKRATKEVA